MRTSTLATLLLPLAACVGAESTADGPAEAEPLVPGADVHLSELSVTCTMQKTGPGTLSVTLENAGRTPLAFLPRGTPWDPYDEVLQVSALLGGALEYQGWHSIRDLPSEAELLTVPAGDRLTIEYSVAERYFPADGGEHRVHIAAPVLLVRTEQGYLNAQHDCGEVRMALDANLGTTRQELGVHDDCNESQRTQLYEAFGVAQTATRLAQGQVRASSGLYRRWFGDWSDRNGTEVAAHYSQILETWDTRAFRCGGTDCCDVPGTNACVTPTILGRKMYVCGRWYSLPMFSVEASSTKSGVIIHESTHKNYPVDAVAYPHPLSTDDIRDMGSCPDSSPDPTYKCYGADNARALALDPTCAGGDADCKAVMNAENYEHFASDVLLGTIMDAI